jgi:glycosyltransferase involved in cell wall biosynthesis
MKICVVAHFAFGALAGGSSGQAGGVERQTSMLACWLAKRGHQVSLVTWDDGQPQDITIDGVRVIKMCRQDDGIPHLRFVWPRWTSLNSALRRADADLYYQNCAEYITGQVALWCKRNRRKFVFSSANDTDCNHDLPELRSIRERVLYTYGLRNADGRIVQTECQQRMLRNGFGVDSMALPMPCPEPLSGNPVPRTLAEKGSPRVAWVGRIAPQKRLELLLKIAKDLPDVAFHVAGEPDRDDEYSRSVLRLASGIPNVVVHGRIPRKKMAEFYGRSALLCCTSRYEGFPNSFLEAWSFGIPLVTSFDPDSIVAKHQMGAVGADVESLRQGILLLLDSPSDWQAASERARQYYLTHHAVEPAMFQFERFLAQVLLDGAPTRRESAE